MKKMLVVCSDCGHEEQINVWSSEEARRKGIQTRPPRCPRCGSHRVQLRG